MAKIIIPWDDGSGDSFYIDYTGIEGSSESLITSDTNLTGVERRKTLVFRTTTASVGTAQQAEAYLTVVQRTDSLIVAMFKGVVSIYDDKKAGYKIDKAQYLRTQLEGLKTSEDEKIQLKEE